MIAFVVFGCANHREARRKSVQLYPGLAQREVVNLFGMPSKAEGNPDEGKRPGQLIDARSKKQTFLRTLSAEGMSDADGKGTD